MQWHSECPSLHPPRQAMYPATTTFSAQQHDTVQAALESKIGAAAAAAARAGVDADIAANETLFRAIRERSFPEWRTATPPATPGYESMMLEVRASVEAAIKKRGSAGSSRAAPPASG